jgi:hypothetical protein
VLSFPKAVIETTTQRSQNEINGSRMLLLSREQNTPRYKLE